MQMPFNFSIIKYLQRSHIDHKTIFYVTLFHTLIGRRNVLYVDHFNIRYNIVLGTIVQHFLGLGYSADA